MSHRFELVIECDDERTARCLDSALGPDNRGFPAGLRFTRRRDARSVRFVVESENLSQAVASIAGMVADAGLFQEVWNLAA